MIKVCDLMHRGVIFCYPNDTAQEIAKIMDTNHVRAVVVVDESGEVWGLISIMEMISLYGKDLENIRAEDIMRPYKIEVDPKWPIQKAIGLMKKQKINHLIIIDPHAGPKRPIGILANIDIVRYMAGLATGYFDQVLKFPSE